jgi:hypothetical protein
LNTALQQLSMPHCSNGHSGLARNNLVRKECAESKGGLTRRLDEELPMWVLLLLPFVGLLWVPFYNFLEPALFGFPFFYWYQLAWVPISSLLIWVVYRSRARDEAP